MDTEVIALKDVEKLLCEVRTELRAVVAGAQSEYIRGFRYGVDDFATTFHRRLLALGKEDNK